MPCSTRDVQSREPHNAQWKRLAIDYVRSLPRSAVSARFMYVVQAPSDSRVTPPPARPPELRCRALALARSRSAARWAAPAGLPSPRSRARSTLHVGRRGGSRQCCAAPAPPHRILERRQVRVPAAPPTHSHGSYAAPRALATRVYTASHALRRRHCTWKHRHLVAIVGSKLRSTHQWPRHPLCKARSQRFPLQ